ncbi:hypothetical protein ACFX2J_023708 [Malus domestica]
MGSSGFNWGFLKLHFCEKKDFHQIFTISNTFGQTPRYPQHLWSCGFLLRVCPPARCFDKSGFTIISGDDPYRESSTKLILAAQPDHLPDQVLSMKIPETSRDTNTT